MKFNIGDKVKIVNLHKLIHLKYSTMKLLNDEIGTIVDKSDPDVYEVVLDEKFDYYIFKKLDYVLENNTVYVQEKFLVLYEDIGDMENWKD